MGALAAPLKRVSADEDACPTKRLEPATRDRILNDAVFALATRMPEYSARTVATRAQVVVVALVVAALATAICLWPGLSARLLVATMSISFVASVIYRTALAWLGQRGPRTDEAAPRAGLPVYTILVPLLHEAAVLPGLVRALLAFDYPRDRLDIKLVIEEDDAETLAAAWVLAAKPIEIVVVPPGVPRTKPKACNYAMHFARGEYLVVYDAEDRPEPDQLLKAAAAFRAVPDAACFQARLAIHNGHQGWLARMFELDYGLWFRTLLPGLDRLGAPMPLGGTSNHFRTAALRAVGAWDPFNVTEDADLGIRLARLGCRVSMLDSTTFEEAPTRLGPWLRQRTRWQKGYMQTLLVHTRHPVRLVRSVGACGMAAIELFLGGAVWSALVNPILWLIFAASLAGAQDGSQLMESLARISGLSLLTANVALATLSASGARPSGRLGALPFALTYFVYWVLISVAAYRALLQLVRDPFRWEKTPHGG